MNIIMRRIPQPQANPTQEKLGQKWLLGHFSPQHIIFHGLGLVLYRKQTTRNLTQPNSPQTPYIGGPLLKNVDLASKLQVLCALTSYVS